MPVPSFERGVRSYQFAGQLQHDLG